MFSPELKVTFLVFIFFFFPGGFCQSSPLRGSGRGLPVQHALCVPAVGADLPTGQDPGGIPGRTRPGGNDPAGADRPGAQYPRSAFSSLCFCVVF